MYRTALSVEKEVVVDVWKADTYPWLWKEVSETRGYNVIVRSTSEELSVTLPGSNMSKDKTKTTGIITDILQDVFIVSLFPYSFDSLIKLP